MSKTTALTLLLHLSLLTTAQQPSAKQAISNLERDIPGLLQQADVPGLSGHWA